MNHFFRKRENIINHFLKEENHHFLRNKKNSCYRECCKVYLGV